MSDERSAARRGSVRSMRIRVTTRSLDHPLLNPSLASARRHRYWTGETALTTCVARRTAEDASGARVEAQLSCRPNLASLPIRPWPTLPSNLPLPIRQACEGGRLSGLALQARKAKRKGGRLTNELDS